MIYKLLPLHYRETDVSKSYEMTSSAYEEQWLELYDAICSLIDVKSPFKSPDQVLSVIAANLGIAVYKQIPDKNRRLALAAFTYIVSCKGTKHSIEAFTRLFGFDIKVIPLYCSYSYPNIQKINDPRNDAEDITPHKNRIGFSSTLDYDNNGVLMYPLNKSEDKRGYLNTDVQNFWLRNNTWTISETISEDVSTLIVNNKYQIKVSISESSLMPLGGQYIVFDGYDYYDTTTNNCLSIYSVVRSGNEYIIKIDIPSNQSDHINHTPKKGDQVHIFSSGIAYTSSFFDIHLYRTNQNGIILDDAETESRLKQLINQIPYIRKSSIPEQCYIRNFYNLYQNHAHSGFVLKDESDSQENVYRDGFSGFYGYSGMSGYSGDNYPIGSCITEENTNNLENPEYEYSGMGVNPIYPALRFNGNTALSNSDLSNPVLGKSYSYLVTSVAFKTGEDIENLQVIWSNGNNVTPTSTSLPTQCGTIIYIRYGLIIVEWWSQRKSDNNIINCVRGYPIESNSEYFVSVQWTLGGSIDISVSGINPRITNIAADGSYPFSTRKNGIQMLGATTYDRQKFDSFVSWNGKDQNFTYPGISESSYTGIKYGFKGLIAESIVYTTPYSVFDSDILAQYYKQRYNLQLPFGSTYYEIFNYCGDINELVYKYICWIPEGGTEVDQVCGNVPYGSNGPGTFDTMTRQRQIDDLMENPLVIDSSSDASYYHYSHAGIGFNGDLKVSGVRMTFFFVPQVDDYFPYGVEAEYRFLVRQPNVAKIFITHENGLFTEYLYPAVVSDAPNAAYYVPLSGNTLRLKTGFKYKVTMYYRALRDAVDSTIYIYSKRRQLGGTYISDSNGYSGYSGIADYLGYSGTSGYSGYHTDDSSQQGAEFEKIPPCQIYPYVPPTKSSWIIPVKGEVISLENTRTKTWKSATFYITSLDDIIFTTMVFRAINWTSYDSVRIRINDFPISIDKEEFSQIQYDQYRYMTVKISVDYLREGSNNLSIFKNGVEPVVFDPLKFSIKWRENHNVDKFLTGTKLLHYKVSETTAVPIECLEKSYETKLSQLDADRLGHSGFISIVNSF